MQQHSSFLWISYILVDIFLVYESLVYFKVRSVISFPSLTRSEDTPVFLPAVLGAPFITSPAIFYIGYAAFATLLDFFIQVCAFSGNFYWY